MLLKSYQELIRERLIIMCAITALVIVNDILVLQRCLGKADILANLHLEYGIAKCLTEWKNLPAYMVGGSNPDHSSEAAA